MTGSKSLFEEPGESGGKLSQKAKDSPFMVVGKCLWIVAKLRNMAFKN